MKYLRKIVLLLALMTPVLGLAQPKMHLKAWIGGNSHRFQYRVEDVDSDFIFGWQGGFGFRIRMQQKFAELDFNFTRYEAIIPLDIPVEEDSIISTEARVRFNSFELPMLVGYVPIKTPLFKWYLQTGLVNRFNVREIFRIDDFDIKEKFKPSDVNLPVYNLFWRVGTQVDIAMINVGFNYSINITNAVRDVSRTNVHILMLDVGFIF